MPLRPADRGTARRGDLLPRESISLRKLVAHRTFWCVETVAGLTLGPQGRLAVGVGRRFIFCNFWMPCFFFFFFFG